MTPPPAQGKARLKRAFPVLLVVLGACSPGTDAPTTTTTPAPTTTASVPATTTQPPTTTTTVDAAVVLGSSLEGTTPNYRFESIFEVEGQALTTISGVVDGSAVAADIVTGSSQVSYVHTDEGEWITDADGTWIVLEGEPPVAPPLAGLADPSSLRLTSGDATNGEITGVLGAAAGSASGIDFTVELANGLVTTILYQANIGAETAQVTTTITDVGSAGGVTPPELG